MQIDIYETPDHLAAAAGELFLATARTAIQARGWFDVMLSGGSTPRAVYTWLAERRDRVDWAAVRFFFGDERCVPPDDADSNYKMAQTALFDALGSTALSVHRIRGELPPYEAAANYQALVRSLFTDDVPRFDLIFLGIGADAHTASLFPGTRAIHEAAAWFVAHEVDASKGWRVTATPPVLNNGRCIAFLVTGVGKAEAVWNVVRGERNIDRFPAQVVAPHDGKLRWLLDRDAAAKLDLAGPSSRSD